MQGNVKDARVALFESIVEQAPDAVIFADRDGAIRRWNRSAEVIFGYTASEVLGGSLDVIIPDRLRSAHWQGFRKAIGSGVTKYAGRVLTTRSAHRDGRKLYVDLSFALIKDADGAIIGALAIARDCTEGHLSSTERPGTPAGAGERGASRP